MKKGAHRRGKVSHNKERGDTLAWLWLIIIGLFAVAALGVFSYGMNGNAVFGLDLREGSQTVIDVFTDWISPFLGFAFGVDSFDELLISRLMIFIILLIIIYLVLKNIEIFNAHPNSTKVVAVIVSLLAVRYLVSPELINAVLLPYGALGVAVSVFIPFLIYFYFVQNTFDTPAGRRVMWVLYGVVFVFLWAQKDTIGSAGWVYTITLLAIAASLMFDKAIHKYFGFSEISGAMKTLNREQRNEWYRQMARFNKDVRDGVYSGQHRDKDRNAEYKRLMDWWKRIEQGKP